jgi:hypothetical protein
MIEPHAVPYERAAQDRGIRSIEPRSAYERAALADIRANKLHVEAIGTRGAVRIFGSGVYLLCASLRNVHPNDLRPREPTINPGEAQC